MHRGFTISKTGSARARITGDDFYKHEGLVVTSFDSRNVHTSDVFRNKMITEI